MLNSSCNSSYKDLAKKTVYRECLIDEQPISDLIVDFRSRMFRYMRLTYNTRSYTDRARSVRIAIKDLRLNGDVVTEKKNVFFATLVLTKKEVEMMRVKKCTYVFPSVTICPFKKAKKEKQAAYTQTRLDELRKRIELYKNNMFDLEAMKQCALALESYIMSQLDQISSMYNGKEWMLGLSNYKIPTITDYFESDRLCARLSRTTANPDEPLDSEGTSNDTKSNKTQLLVKFYEEKVAQQRRSCAILSEDFDVLILFGADIMIKEVYNKFFVYISLKDTMVVFDSVSRKNAIHRCCIMGTDYNMGLKGVGPVKAKKIDDVKAKELFEICLAAQSIKFKDLYQFFLF